MRCNLASAVFPFATQLWGRSIIVPQFDMNFDRTVNAIPDIDKDKGIPQAFYMHNCIPTVTGYQSIGYDQEVAGIPGADDFDMAFPFQSVGQARFIFVPAAGKNYVYDAVVGAWASRNPVLPPGTLREDIIVTMSFVQGETYFCYANYGTIKYNPVTKAMDPVTLAGISNATNKGLCAANGYNIAWNDTDVAWSSAVDPLDFVPSLITGAGSGTVNDAKGKIICCLPISGGFLIYCEKNVVAATYSGNIRFPFIYKEVEGSGGISSPEQVSWQGNLSTHYAWTTVGLQSLNKLVAQPVFPDATDFLAAKIFEDFDELTLLFTTTFLADILNIKLTVIADRYVVISYGIQYPIYTHALYFDIPLKRWGKFKITHRDVFQWNAPNLYGALTYGQLGSTTYGDFGPHVTYGDLLTFINTPEVVKENLAFLLDDGTIKTVNFDLAQTVSSGVLVIGKFQFMRNFFITHQQTDVQTIQDANDFACYILPTLDGQTFLPAVPAIEVPLSGLTRRFAKRITGMNYSDLFIGAFNMCSLLTNFTKAGQR